MKKVLITVLVVLIVLSGIIFFIEYSRSSRFKGPTYKKTEEEQYEFIATIIGVYQNSILVEPEEGSNERKSSDKISMSITRTINETNDFYVIGNKVKITYDGMIMESYPSQIVATKIELIK